MADQPGNAYGKSRDNIELQAIIAIMSAGPIGIGDGVGFTDATLIKKMSRSTPIHSLTRQSS